MQLVITRSQGESPFTFTATYHLQLSPTERANFDRYNPPDLEETLGGHSKVDALLAGTYAISDANLKLVTAHEQRITTLCQEAEQYLRAAIAYQGVKTVSLDTDESPGVF